MEIQRELWSLVRTLQGESCSSYELLKTSETSGSPPLSSLYASSPWKDVDVELTSTSYQAESC